MLNVAHLNVRYGVTEVLRDVSFDVPDGRIVALLGGNGSGKTTILNTLTGLLKPRAGSISVGGVAVAGWSPDRLVRLGVSQVPQGREVFAAMTEATSRSSPTSHASRCRSCGRPAPRSASAKAG